MNIINSFSSVRFTFNGVQYVRNYISAVYGTDIEVFNCYERKDVLIPRTHYSNFMVNGSSLGSAAALQSVLLGVIYSRNSLGGGAFEQDNIDIKKHFRFSEGTTLAQVVQKVNALPQYTVNEKQSVWFIGLRSSGNFTYGNFSVVKYKLLNKGMGTYGTGGIQVTANDVELVYHNKAGIADIAGDPSTTILQFSDILTPVSGWINTRTPITISPAAQGLTLFQGSINNVTRSYIFTGEAGRYGTGALQATENDFEEVDDAAPDFIPSIQQVVDTGRPLTTPLTIEDKVTGGKTSYSGLGKSYTSAAGKVVSTMYQEPVESVKYTIPAKNSNDTFAMISDVKVQDIKYIDSEVINNVYTITGDDFGSMLIYNGNTNITLLLSTNAAYQTGSNLNFIQAGAGTITFATDGFIIKHALDEQPVTYGTSAIAGITVIDEFVVLLFGKLKPAS